MRAIKTINGICMCGIALMSVVGQTLYIILIDESARPPFITDLVVRGVVPGFLFLFGLRLIEPIYRSKIGGGAGIVLGFMMFLVGVVVFYNSPMSSGDIIRLVAYILFGAVVANIGVLIMKKSGAE